MPPGAVSGDSITRDRRAAGAPARSGAAPPTCSLHDRHLAVGLLAFERAHGAHYMWNTSREHLVRRITHGKGGQN
eukprot:3055383-Prymnesium_polylepis.1